MRVCLFAGVLLSLFSTVVFAQWELLRGLATDIGVGARGDAMAVGIDRVEGGHSLYRWIGSDWQIVPGGAVRIDLDPQGNPWVVNSAGQILRAGPAGWQQLPGLARDIGIGANGSVWVVGVTPTPGGFTIHRWNGRDWDLVPGGAVRIDVDPRGTPWVVNDRGDILRRTPSGQWQRLPGSATAVTIATDGTAWMLGSDPVPGGYSIQRWNGQRWRRVNGGGVALSAGTTPWLVNSDNQIFRWSGKR
jgi:hypothetical protein